MQGMHFGENCNVPWIPIERRREGRLRVLLEGSFQYPALLGVAGCRHLHLPSHSLLT